MRVLTMGSFDMLHPGHLGLFDWCRKIAQAWDEEDFGDGRHEVVVAVNSTAFIMRFKTEPRYTTEERMIMVSQLKAVDRVVENTGLDQPSLILSVKPDILVIGSDWAPAGGKDYLAQIGVTQEWLDEHRIALAYVPRTPGWSSTELRGRHAS